MWVYIVIAAVLATASIAGYSACKSPAGGGDKNGEQPKDTVKNKLSKKDILAKLAELKEKPLPKNLNPGAMCYAKAVYKDTSEFVCPVCNHRTLHTGYMSQHLKYDVPRAKSVAARIKTMNLRIDETHFCEKCRPKDAYVAMCLVVSYPDEPAEHKTCSVSAMDLVMIEEFLSGSTVHHSSQDNEMPMQECIPRLETLLGIKLK